MSVIEQGLIRSGKWYNPYIHSVPQNFAKSRNAYYSGFSIDSAITKAEHIAKRIFEGLISFYSEREESLRKFLNMTDLATEIGPFLDTIEQMWDRETAKGGEAGFMSEIPQILKDTDKLFAQLTSNDAIKKRYEQMMKKSLDSINANPTKTAKDITKQNTVLAHDYKKRLVSLQNNNNPNNQEIEAMNQIANRVIKTIIFGDPAPQKGEAAKFLKKLKKDHADLVKLGEEIKSGSSVITEAKKAKKTTPRAQASRMLGRTNEHVINRIVQDLFKAGVSLPLNLFVDTLQKQKISVKSEVTGGKSKDRIQDVTITLTNSQGEAMDIGLDIKYSAKKNREYKRGPNKKPITEIMDLIPNSAMQNELLYLMVNSYIHNDTSTYNNFLGSAGSSGEKELFGLINVVRGLYGILPADRVNFVTYSNIEGFVKQDNRFLIMVNNNTLLMSEFLERIRKQVLNTDGVTGTVKNLRSSKKGEGFEDIVDKMARAHDIPGGKGSDLYDNKIRIKDILVRSSKAQGVAKSAQAHSQLTAGAGSLNSKIYKAMKVYVNSNVTNSNDLKNKWKFLIDNTVFTFRPRK